MNNSYVLDTLLSKVRNYYLLSPNFGGHHYSNECNVLMKRVVR